MSKEVVNHVEQTLSEFKELKNILTRHGYLETNRDLDRMAIELMVVVELKKIAEKGDIDL